MKVVHFAEANSHFGPPPGLTEHQCLSVPAFQHNILGGSCDGLRQVVVAYQLTDEEKQRLIDGDVIYMSMIGGLAPHYLSLSFHEATHPA